MELYYVVLVDANGVEVSLRVLCNGQPITLSPTAVPVRAEMRRVMDDAVVSSELIFIPTSELKDVTLMTYLLTI